ncbi:superoxide dismutase [Lentzea tibetensis]|uniref:Superoxide dismutase n=1 Tax=Lentzea tibetensis TaxID=2591470 RepID=A0A563EVX3_9PSEU|nr:superoxide dismutase [Lentzea tibetensis]TWP51803.1 superoxide dismutase [Lentzea tibetensis]
MQRRIGVLVAAVLGLTLAGAAPVTAAETAAETAGKPKFPTEITLPAGWQPEGIAISGRTAYFGSRVDGSIYAADLRTGRGEVFVKGTVANSLGMKVDSRGRLWVSGGPSGQGRVYDTRSGKLLASYQFATADTFVNDVIVTHRGAWFTDSRKAVLYQVPLNLPKEHRTLALTGELVVTPGATNLNGIETTVDGRALFAVQSNTGLLFRVDPATGATKAVNLGGEVLTNGDGLLRIGHNLYVVQNRLNTVAKYRLTNSGGTLVSKTTDPRFDVPTTVAAFGDRLYLPNARFSTPPTPTTPYNAVAIDRP